MVLSLNAKASVTRFHSKEHSVIRSLPHAYKPSSKVKYKAECDIACKIGLAGGISKVT